MKIALFDAKPYDYPAFNAATEASGDEIKYFDIKLSPDTVGLADGFDAVCVFVNDKINSEVIDKLYSFNNKYYSYSRPTTRRVFGAQCGTTHNCFDNDYNSNQNHKWFFVESMFSPLLSSSSSYFIF